METAHQQHFSEFEDYKSPYRRSLLPWWIRFFSWVFMVAGVVAVLEIIIAITTGANITSTFYGLNLFPDLYGAVSSGLVLLFNAVTGYYLWTEKKSAIQLAKICAIIGIFICVLTTIGSLFFASKFFMLRLEIVFLILFYRKADAIEYDWEVTAIARNGRD